MILCAGCRQLLGFDTPVHAVDAGDAGASDTPDAPPDSAAMCFGSGAFAFCLPAPPTGSPVLPPTLNTDTATECLAVQPPEWRAAGQPDACFLVGANVTVPLGFKLVAGGTRPLVIVGGSSLEIDGVIDVSSHVGGTEGAGMGTAMNCPQFATNAGSAGNGTGGPGGAGGTLMTQGGNGGTGGAGGGGGHAGNALAQAPALLRGGCFGQDGGAGNAGLNGGPAGRGGGSVYLVSGGMITIAGVVNASGGGAPAANKYDGGGGGGSGGMIVLWSPRYAGSGVLIANGGGGASGGDGNQGGAPGANPNPAEPFLPAAGGTSGTGGRPGCVLRWQHHARRRRQRHHRRAGRERHH